MTTTDSIHQHICATADYFTNWPEVYPLKSESAEETISIYDFVDKCGASQILLTDQVTE